jgi:hypothetical protein
MLIDITVSVDTLNNLIVNGVIPLKAMGMSAANSMCACRHTATAMLAALQGLFTRPPPTLYGE